MKYSNIPAAQTVVHHCKEQGIKNIVISPGSRNAPLTIGFTGDPFFKCFSVVDERAAAFFALGIAQQLRTPVVALCTSGSAVLNYYPAVAEAFYSNIPLVVISADRPPYKIDVGDGQTIRQENVFKNHIGYCANLRLDVSHNTEVVKRFDPDIFTGTKLLKDIQKDIQAYNDLQLNEALQKAICMECPVHINVPFEEPLYATIDTPSLSAQVVPVPEMEAETPKNLDRFVKQWNAAKRKMILVGVNPPGSVEQRFLDRLAADPSVLVFTETTSNLHHPNFFPSIDSIVAPIEKRDDRSTCFAKLKPDVLLTFGGLIVSKKIKAFLRDFKPRHHWHVGTGRANDTFFCLKHHFNTNINTFLSTFLPQTREVDSDYFNFWTEVKNNYLKKRTEYVKQSEFSDLKVFDIVLQTIPRDSLVHLANSSTVRYAQLFDMHPSLKVFCNRGTSGIDGSTSTAIGASIYSESPTVLITGDLSFFYDNNGLWNAALRPDFRIVLINNNGGGIFRILPGKEASKNFETYFETVQNLQAKTLCELHGIEHTPAETEEQLKSSLSEFYKPSEKAKLLEIKTPRLINDKILLTYFDFISSDIINKITSKH